MKRGSPLKRRTRLNPIRKAPRRSSMVVDKDYRARVAELPCISLSMMTREPRVCAMGLSHAHHMREAAGLSGMGKKPSDSYCIPFCSVCHDNWHTHSGKFKDCSRDWRVAFAIAAVQETRSRLGWEEGK